MKCFEQSLFPFLGTSGIGTVMFQELTPDTLVPLRFQKGEVWVLDQRQLPHTIHWQHIHTDQDMANAIQTMIIRGAPAIGVAGAFGVALGVQRMATQKNFFDELKLTVNSLIATRPTAINLAWACQQVYDALEHLPRAAAASDRMECAFATAESLRQDDVHRCKVLSQLGADLCDLQENFLTICNAGALATAGYGTAVGVIRRCHELGKKVHVWICETRPRLQGASLTAFECQVLGIPYTLITDSMAGSLMAQHRITKVITGADRITANGDTANKIGTYSLAVLAHVHDIPFWVAAPGSTFDLTCTQGCDIPIEMRSETEILKIHNTPIAPSKAHAFNPAFDVTPAKWISKFITEKGILTPPFKELRSSKA